MKISLFVMLIFSISVKAKTYRMVQGSKTFLGDVTDKMAADAYDDPSIEENHKVETLSAKVGDKIVFANRDEVSHNVSGSIKEVVAFDVKLQDPGVLHDKTIDITKPGEYVIQCAIHPKMKIKMKVE